MARLSCPPAPRWPHSAPRAALQSWSRGTLRPGPCASHCPAPPSAHKALESCAPLDAHSLASFHTCRSLCMWPTVRLPIQGLLKGPPRGPPDPTLLPSHLLLLIPFPRLPQALQAARAPPQAPLQKYNHVTKLTLVPNFPVWPQTRCGPSIRWNITQP